MEIETHKITRKTQKKMSLTFKKKSEFLILLLYPVVSLMSHRHPTEKEDGGVANPRKIQRRERTHI